MKNKETNQEENVISRSVKRFLGNSTTFSKEEQKAIVLALEIGEAYEQLILKLQKYESKMKKRKDESPNAGDEILENTVMYGINGMTNCLQEIFAKNGDDFSLAFSIFPIEDTGKIKYDYCNEPYTDGPNIYEPSNATIMINDKYGVFNEE